MKDLEGLVHFLCFRAKEISTPRAGSLAPRPDRNTRKAFLLIPIQVSSDSGVIVSAKILLQVHEELQKNCFAMNLVRG